MGFVVHPTKSTLIPTQEIVTLGFEINSVKMTIRLTTDKAISLKNDCKTLLMSDKPTLIREVARVIGKIVASFPGVMYGPLYYRYLEGDRSQALKKEKGNFDAYMVFSTQARSELQWWVDNVEVAYQTLAREAPKEKIFTDASLSGWGAEFQGTSTGGQWTVTESKNHINYWEMLAIFLGLRTYASKKANIHIRMCDNTSAVNILNHMGTSHSDPCNELAKVIWEWCIKRSIWMSIAHIPGKNNVATDFESRRNQRESEWMLDITFLCEALKCLEVSPVIDLFASRINKQLPRYVSYHPDPDAEAIDAFTLNWENLIFYTFPPFNVIPTVLAKIQKERAEGIVVLPDWPTQSWYAKASKLMEKTTSRLEDEQEFAKTTNSPGQSSPDVAKTEPSGLPLIRKSLEQYKLSSSAKDILMASCRAGTTKQYQTYLAKWQAFCNEHRLDTFAPGIENAIEFFWCPCTTQD